MASGPNDGARVALVTGAAGVIGGTVVKRLKADGWKVAGLDVKGGAGDLPLAVDVSDRDAVTAAATRVRAELGPIDLLVTAANDCEIAPMGELPVESWKRMLGVNLGGTVNACAAVVPGMVEAGRGTVVTTTSWLSVAGGCARESYYAASIGAVIAFTKSFSVEVAKMGVRVNCVAVGPLQEGGSGSLLARVDPQSLPARRLTKPEDVAETVAFLADEGDFYVGQVFAPCAGAVI